jgi:hypothetical protein
MRGVALGAIVGSCLVGAILAIGCTGGSQAGLANILVLVLLFAIGVPWNLLLFLILSAGQNIAVAIPLPMACYGGHQPPTDDWGLFGKIILISLAAGAFVNGCLLTWAFTRPKSQGSVLGREMQQPNAARLSVTTSTTRQFWLRTAQALTLWVVGSTLVGGVFAANSPPGSLTLLLAAWWLGALGFLVHVLVLLRKRSPNAA